MSNPLSRLLPGSGSSQDTMSKLLPSVPDMDTQLQLAAKMIDKKTATHKVRIFIIYNSPGCKRNYNFALLQGQHSYGSYFLEYSLMAEYNLLLKQKLPGIYCIPSANSSLLWYGVLFIRQGPYQEGVFRLVPSSIKLQNICMKCLDFKSSFLTTILTEMSPKLCLKIPCFILL